jgi:3-hydroxyacyl-CoA dehydrogenase
MAKRDEVQRSQPESFSPVRCIAAIEAAIALPLSEGLQRERTLFLECMASPQREALIQAFFAQRQAAKAVGPDAAVTPCKPPAPRQERLAAESKTVAELDQQG